MSLTSNQLNITDSRITNIRDFINTLNIQDIQGHSCVINPTGQSSVINPCDVTLIYQQPLIGDYQLISSGSSWVSTSAPLLPNDIDWSIGSLEDWTTSADWELSDGDELLASDSTENSDILPDDDYGIASDDSGDDITESGGDLPLGAGTSNTAEMDAWWADMLAHDISLVDDGNAIIDVVGSYEEGELINVRSGDNCDFSTYWVNKGSGKYEDSFLLDDKADIICDADGNIEILTASSPDSYGWISLHSKAPSVVCFTDEGTAIRNSSGSMPVIGSGDINMAQPQIDLTSSSMLNVPPIVFLASGDMISTAANLGLTDSSDRLLISSGSITTLASFNTSFTGILTVNADIITTNINTLDTGAILINNDINAILGTIDNDNSTGTVAVDIIYGQAGDDSFHGLGGNDTLDGGEGNDTLAGGRGADSLIGGAGNDVYRVDNVGDVVTETSTLTTEMDKVNSLISYTLGANLENLTLKGTAAISGIGNELNNLLKGNGANNILQGDIGNDRLIGGLGKDNLTGGLGADKFKFNSEAETGITATTRDIITDFSHAQRDKINLSAIDANTDLAGNNAFSAPTVGGTFSGSFANPGELYFDQTAHILYGNNDADSIADFSIKLAGVNSLAAADFVL